MKFHRKVPIIGNIDSVYIYRTIVIIWCTKNSIWLNNCYNISLALFLYRSLCGPKFGCHCEL